MSGQLVQVLEGNTFVVSDTPGDIEASLTDPTGLFAYDTRFLSRWVLTVNGKRLNCAVDRRPQVLRGRVLPGPRDRHGVRRRQALGHPAERRGRRLRRAAHDPEPRRRTGRCSTVRIEAASDFADLFEVKDALAKKGSLYAQVEEDGSCSATARDVRARDGDLLQHAGGVRRTRPHVPDHDPAPRRVDDRRSTSGSSSASARVTPGGTRHASMARGVEKLARRQRLDLECDAEALGTPTGAASSTWLRCASPAYPARPLAACRRTAVVHGHVRARQHLHQPAGAAVRPELAATTLRALGRTPRPAWTTSATRTPAGSSTRCATAS